METYSEKLKALLDALDAPTQDALAGATTLRQYGKGDFLLREGEVCRLSFFIETGIVRKFYLKNGTDITTDFTFGGDLILSLSSYVLQQPSQEWIQALTDCRVQVTDHLVFNRLKTKYPQLLELDVALLEAYALWLEARLSSLQFQTAAERYARLLRLEPQLVRRVPLTHIASYLGITLETLSRLRGQKT